MDKELTQFKGKLQITKPQKKKKRNNEVGLLRLGKILGFWECRV